MEVIKGNDCVPQPRETVLTLVRQYLYVCGRHEEFLARLYDVRPCLDSHLAVVYYCDMNGHPAVIDEAVVYVGIDFDPAILQVEGRTNKRHSVLRQILE